MQSIDYAGIFPPCSLALEPALRNQAKYIRSDDAWMLNTFVLPVIQFDSAKQLLPHFDPLHPLQVNNAMGLRTNCDPLQPPSVADRKTSAGKDLRRHPGHPGRGQGDHGRVQRLRRA